MKPFEQIVSEHGPTVLRVCRALLGPDEAEDAWSETFLAALAELPRKQRIVLAYHYLAGLPYAEIAAITGGTDEAARRAAADGIKKLRAGYLAEITEGAGR